MVSNWFSLPEINVYWLSFSDFVLTYRDAGKVLYSTITNVLSQLLSMRCSARLGYIKSKAIEGLQFCSRLRSMVKIWYKWYHICLRIHFKSAICQILSFRCFYIFVISIIFSLSYSDLFFICLEDNLFSIFEFCFALVLRKGWWQQNMNNFLLTSKCFTLRFVWRPII